MVAEADGDFFTRVSGSPDALGGVALHHHVAGEDLGKLNLCSSSGSGKEE